ncbi:hypothetical protein T02_14288 [Trichinella nativa]|uniref:Uncharacterized protein n=1 Tax=Trichinella nativa TaxID=6335 RepID=A0A0V1LQQ1_9BILA|nr:hypothetical protein T02_14288 [Trichinella nativa]
MTNKITTFLMCFDKFSESDLKLQMRLDRKQIVTNCFVFCLSRKRKYFFQSCGIALMSKKRGNMLEMGCREFFNVKYEITFLCVDRKCPLLHDSGSLNEI